MYTALICLSSYEVVYRMDLSVESCKHRLCQIHKTVKIFENVAFLAGHFFKSIYLLQARNISFLTLSLLVIVHASLLSFC